MNKNYLLCLLLISSNGLFVNFYSMNKSSTKHVNLISIVKLSNDSEFDQEEVQQVMHSINEIRDLSVSKTIYNKALRLLLDMCFWGNLVCSLKKEHLEILKRFDLINYENKPTRVVYNVIRSWVNMSPQMEYTFKGSPFKSYYSSSVVSDQSSSER